MRTLTTSLVALGLAALVGCNTSPPGGSGGSRGTAGTAGNTSSSATFDVTAPTLTTNIKQGETQEVKLKVNRGRDFKDYVTITFDAPAGLKVEPATVKVASSDKEEVAVRVTADKGATVGDHTVKATATPGSGTATSVEFKVKVEAATAK